MVNNGKATGLIEHCCLQKPPFDNVAMDFSWVNFFFGKNAAGKSTVADAIAQKQGLTCREGDAVFAVYHFNQEYIDRNMRMYEGMPGIFSLGQQEGDAAEQLKALQDKLDEVRQQRTDAEKRKNDVLQRGNNLKKKHLDDCWEKTDNYRKNIFSSALSKFSGSKAALVDALKIQDVSQVRSESEIQSEYRRVFQSEGTTYPDYASIADAYHGLSIEEENLLGQVIAAKEDTPYARFLGRLKAQDWARHGHDQFQADANGKCPYCGQSLPDGFEEIFRQCFDDQYQADIARIETIRRNYQEMRRQIEWILDDNEKIKCPFNEALTYAAKSAKLKNLLSSNLYALEQKVRNPSMPVKLDSLDVVISDLEAARLMVNTSIAVNNDAVANKKKARETCRQAILTFIAARLQKEFAEFKNAMEICRNAFEKFDSDYQKYDQEYSRLDKEATELRKQCANSEKALENIKKMIRESGFKNFSLRRKPGVPHTYEVFRPKGGPLGRLSEGERNSLAFLYFYQELCGARPEGTSAAKRIVIIDDPVSSMDSGVISIVASFIRKLIKICLNKQGEEPIQNSVDDIRQIFIFTHNDFFFELVSTPYLRDRFYSYVSIFNVIKKPDGHSKIEACIHNHPVHAGMKKNYCPVKNSYATLWDEYADLRDTEHIPALMNVIRQILERYFIQISRHNSDSLDALIEAHSSDFENLSECDENDYILAKSLVASIGAYESANEHMLIPQEDMDASQCQRIFEMIFNALGQGEHYRMMMGLS